MKYRVADLLVEIFEEPRSIEQAQKYAVDTDEKIDFTVRPYGYEKYARKPRTINFEDYQYVTCGSDFYRKLLNYNGIMLHSSAVVVDGKAYLFSATCGTGKSTHTSKWLELFGDKAFIINDDKPAIRIIDGEFYVYGTPWSGKHDISVNAKAKLQAICFLDRDDRNWIKLSDKAEAFTKLYQATLKNLHKEELGKELNIIESILREIPIYDMGCTPTVEAAKMAYEQMSK